MKHSVKKFIALFLALTICISTLSVAAFAADDGFGKTPVIYVRGSGDDIIDANGKQVWHTSVNTDGLGDTVKEVVYPYLVNAVLKNEWDAYFDKLSKEIGDIFAGAYLDNNGEATNGTSLRPERYAENADSMSRNKADANGNFPLWTYNFWYDWRTDPWTVADDMNDYINAVLEKTGKEKVGIIARCLGVSFVMAYIAKYGTDKISSLGFNSSVSGAMEITTDAYTGNLTLDSRSVVRFEKDLLYISRATPWLGSFIGSLFDESIAEYVDETVDAAVDIMRMNGTLAVTSAAVEAIYNMLFYRLVPKMVMATMGTWVGYWTTVKPEEYENARDFIFGEPGSEMYEQYKGLIAKTDNYYEKVASHFDELLINAKNSGIRINNVTKYGYQGYPFGETCNVIGDKFAGVTGSSFGATAAEAEKTLPACYIKKAQSEGRDKYISPDKQIDASTCLFPDYTWFVKGIVHDWYPPELDMLLWNCAQESEQVTIDTYPEYPQYMVFDDSNETLSPQTKENSAVEHWNLTYKFGDMFRALRRFFQNLFEIISFLRTQNEANG